MSPRPPSPSLTAVTARLRAAGCVFAEDEARLLLAAATTPAHLARMVERRAAGLPLEQVIGWAEFCGLRVRVGPGVFVPRHRTEFLVAQAMQVTRPGAVVVDLCCGSGAVGLAVAVAVPGVELHAVDVDPVAVACARGNLEAAGGQVHLGDLYDALPEGLRGRVDVLVANAPYVPTGDVDLLPREARVHEPPRALDGGADGLDVHRRIVAGAGAWLAAGGRLLLETSDRQAPRMAGICARRGLAATAARCEQLEATVVIARPGR